MAQLVVIILLLQYVLAQDDLIAGGKFGVTLIDDNGQLHRVSSLMGYNAASDSFQDSFAGGVYTPGVALHIASTPSGTYISGNFRRVGPEGEYSYSVAAIDSEGLYQPLDGGIWVVQPNAVKYITGFGNDYVVFAGDFTSVEAISYASYLAGNSSSVDVPNLIVWDVKNQQWELLPSNPTRFDGSSMAGVVSSPVEEKLYIYMANVNAYQEVYSWDPVNYYTQLTTSFSVVPGTVICDNNGNLAGIQQYIQYIFTDPKLYMWLIYYNVTSDRVTSYAVFEGEDDVDGLATIPTVIPWEDGVLAPIPAQYNGGWFATAFWFLDPSANRFAVSGIPNLNIQTFAMVGGSDADIWVAPRGPTNEVYYYYMSTWNAISLTSVVGTNKFTTYSMTFDSQNQCVIILGVDNDSNNIILNITSGSLPPVVKTVNPGPLYDSGQVNTLTSVPNSDNSDYDVYVGGTFDYAGFVSASNFARWSNGEWTGLSSSPIGTMTSYNQVVFYGSVDCPSTGQSLPIEAYSTTGTPFTFASLPKITSLVGCVRALYSDDKYLYVGGNFSVSITGNPSGAHGLVAYNWKSQKWIGFEIPATTFANPTSMIYAITSTVIVDSGNAQPTLAIGGKFVMSFVGLLKYRSFALLDLSTLKWINIPETLQQYTDVYTLSNGQQNQIYLGGDISTIPFYGPVVSYVYPNSYTKVGTISEPSRGAFATNGGSTVYDFGLLGGSPNYGLMRAEYPGNPIVTWEVAGNSTIFANFYQGPIMHLGNTTLAQ